MLKISNSNYLLLIGLVFVITLSINLIVNPLQEANAVTSLVITTTVANTQDVCGGIAQDGYGDVWQVCGATTTGGGTLYVMNATGHALGNSGAIVNMSPGNNLGLLPLFASSDSRSILLYYAAIQAFYKYQYNPATGAVSLVGQLAPACTVSGEPSYDVYGNLWFVCPTDHKYGVMNPTTMASRYVSPVLNTGSPACSTPRWIQPDTTTALVGANHGIAILGCETGTDIIMSISYDLTTFAFVAKLSSVAPSGGITTSTPVYADPQANSVYYSTASSGFTRYTYSTTTGVFTLASSGIGAVSAKYCSADFYISTSQDHNMACEYTNGVEIFISNSTGLYQAYSTALLTRTHGDRMYAISLDFFNTKVFASQGPADNSVNKFISINYLDLELAPTDPNPVVTPTENNTNTGGIDCTDPAYSYRLICNIGGTGSLAGTSTLLNQSGTNIVCQVGILHCTQVGNVFTPDNPDMKTNGVGYLLTMVLMGVMVGMLWVASRGDLTNIPTFVWFISTIGILGGATAMQWIDPTFLVIGIIAIVALAVAKVKGLLGGQTMFAGESG